LSTSWDDNGSIGDIGFGTPLQFKEFKDSLAVGLPMTCQLQLLDLKSSSEKLEWLVAECLQKHTIVVPYFLCFDGKHPMVSEKHEVIPWRSFSIQTHANIMMKPCPDTYGTGRYMDN
jgi:hypothetical protein